EKQIVIKSEVCPDTPPMAAQPPFDRLLYMPILLNPRGAADLTAIAIRQMTGAHPAGIELPRLDEAQLAPLAAAARAHGVRLWI
ncbi:hypothetical protein LXA31_18055, partial [Erwinia amylovora]|uniref:hypothetical protein n=1 Tax=Erwinia amylovora TaxID=552 RepID=UPI0020BF182A